MKIIGISDTSYKSNDKSIGGVFLFMADDNMRTASLLYWKSKQIEHVYHSSKDAETLTISKKVDDVLFTGKQQELLLHKDYRKKIKVDLYTDLESSLESIASSRQIEWKTLRIMVRDLKDCL